MHTRLQVVLWDIRAYIKLTVKQTRIAATGLGLVSPGSMVPYAYGDSNSSECPANFLRITTEDGCRAAAVAMGTLFGGFYNTPARPAGCYGSFGFETSTVYLNVIPVGAGFPDRLLLCAGAPLAHVDSVMPCPCERSDADPERVSRVHQGTLDYGVPTRACHLCSLALPLLHPSLGSDTGVCSSDGIADPVADQYRRHKGANISTDDVGADIAIADIPRDTIAHVRRCSLPTAVHLIHCPNRPGPSVQEGPLRGARWAGATNVPPTTFALSTRAPVRVRRPPLARLIPFKTAKTILPAR